MNNTKVLSHAEIASFCRQSAMIIKAGITPAEGMNILHKDTADSEGKELLKQIASSCQQGNPFSTALESTEVFPYYVIHLIALGEESGNLDDVLISLADYYDREESVSDSIKSAVTYPLIMIAMMVIIILVLIVKVLPIFRQVFTQLGTEMNAFATSLLSIGNTLSKYSLIITVFIFLIVISALIFYKSSYGKNKIMHFLTRFPLSKKFYEKIAAGRFANGMYLALTSGMDTYKSLDMISEIVEHHQMRSKIDICKQSLEKGMTLPEALADAGIFSNLYSRMISVGFRSGSVDLVFKQIAQNYDAETEKQLNRIISIIEPTLVIILSLIVGMILLSVLLPLMGIMSSIG